MRAWGRYAWLALAIRLCLIAYGEWQDRNYQVKYTDVDYHVFNDAARSMAQGGSPFERKTYRYTPLLAALLLPGQWLGLVSIWGKLLFVMADLACGWHLYQLLKLNSVDRKQAMLLVGVGWLFNPMVMGVSTRGNAESILCTLIVSSLYHLKRHRLVMAGLFLGTAVHFKLFPAIFALPMAIWTVWTYLLDGGRRPRRTIVDDTETSKIPRPTSHLTTPPQPLHPKGPLRHVPFMAGTKIESKRYWMTSLGALFKLGGSALLVFAGLTAFMLWRYGMVYWEEAFWYHLVRRDHRHNFAPHFLPFYLQSIVPLPSWIGLAAFVPQLLALLAIGVKFGYQDLGFACFMQTVVFVTFNKVCTSQVRIR